MEYSTVTFGEWLAATRRRVGISRKRLAEASGVSYSFLTSWERDEGIGRLNSGPIVSTVKQICHGLVPDYIPTSEREAFYENLVREALAIEHGDVLSPDEVMPYSEFEFELSTVAKTIPPQLRKPTLELIRALPGLMGFDTEDFTRYSSGKP